MTQKHIGDTMHLKVLRDGKVQELEVRPASFVSLKGFVLCCCGAARCRS